MKKNPPRIRMFAGPNGSGKSTIKSVISPELLGVYVNPDEIESQIADSGFLDLTDFSVTSDPEEVSAFFAKSTLLMKENLGEFGENVVIKENKISFSNLDINAYAASVLADFIRTKLIESQRSFTFETVMSSPDKVQLLKLAQQKGFRTYLYYVSTEDPEINISRIRHRVKMGGHDVPQNKTESRFYRSLDLLIDAVKFTNRAYIFDNSSHEHIWLAEITDGKMLELKSDLIPNWFQKALLDKLTVLE